MAVIYTDITKQKTIEKVVHRHQRFLKRILRTINDGILIYDLDYRVLFINKAAKNMLGEVPVGRKVTQKLLKTFVDIKSGEVFPKEKLPYFQVLRTGRPIMGVEFGILKEDGGQITVSVSSIPWLDKEGQLEGVVSVLNDITIEKEADYQREQIVGIVGHEMKNPLASIKLLAQMVKKKMDEQGQKGISEYASKIDEKVDTLVKIINNLSEATRIRLGKIDIQWELIEVDVFIKEMVEEMQPIMGTHRLIIKGKTGARTLADRERLKQVMVNLVGNAVKYSPGKDQVLIKLKRRNGSFVIEVVDYGVGVNSKEVKKIFDLYYSKQQKGVVMGTGIGLYVVKGIILAHGGKIEVESEVGRGSCFRVIIPIVEGGLQKRIKKVVDNGLVS